MKIFEDNLISIIIPVFNSEDTLERALDSVLHQEYSSFEIILVNDGSTDNSLAICKRYEELDSRVHVISIDNAGPSAARNMGLRYMKGQFLAFVDADDTVAVDVYSRLITDIKTNNVIMAISNWENICEDGTHYCDSFVNVGCVCSDEITRSVFFSDFQFGGGYPWNRVVDYKAIYKLNGYDDVLFPENVKRYEDKCWNIKLFSLVDYVYVDDFVGYHYYIRNNSLSRTVTIESMEAVFVAWDYMTEVLENDGLYNKEIHKKNSNRYLRSIIWFKNNNKTVMINKWIKYKYKYGWNCSSIKNVLRSLYFEFESLLYSNRRKGEK